MWEENLDEVNNFVSLVDQKDAVEYYSDDDSDSDTESEDDETIDCMEEEHGYVDVEEQSVVETDGGNDAEAEECDSDSCVATAVAEAVQDVIVEGHHSVKFVEGGLIFTSNKTEQICTLSLSGAESDCDTETDDSRSDGY